jgi:hypothetical protein
MTGKLSLYQLAECPTKLRQIRNPFIGRVFVIRYILLALV